MANRRGSYGSFQHLRISLSAKEKRIQAKKQKGIDMENIETENKTEGNNYMNGKAYDYENDGRKELLNGKFRYPEELKIKAMQYAGENGTKEAADYFHIPEQTIVWWFRIARERKEGIPARTKEPLRISRKRRNILSESMKEKMAAEYLSGQGIQAEIAAKYNSSAPVLTNYIRTLSTRKKNSLASSMGPVFEEENVGEDFVAVGSPNLKRINSRTEIPTRSGNEIRLEVGGVTISAPSLHAIKDFLNDL